MTGPAPQRARAGGCRPGCSVRRRISRCARIGSWWPSNGSRCSAMSRGSSRRSAQPASMRRLRRSRGAPAGARPATAASRDRGRRSPGCCTSPRPINGSSDGPTASPCCRSSRPDRRSAGCGAFISGARRIRCAAIPCRTARSLVPARDDRDRGVRAARPQRIRLPRGGRGRIDGSCVVPRISRCAASRARRRAAAERIAVDAL